MRAPVELKKITLPQYRIEPPDVLQIEMLKLVPLPPYRAESFDVLQLHVLGALPEQPIDGFFMVEAEGTINLGPAYGSVRVAGMTLDEVKRTVYKKLQEVLKARGLGAVGPRGRGPAGDRPVPGGPDGTINLRQYGLVNVAGKTVTEARVAIQKHLTQFLDSPELSVEVVSYNSKVYYVITQGAGMGDSVRRFPITGNETVLDAIAS